MLTAPELSLLPMEQPPAPLRCCLCLRRVSELLELPYGPVCRPCLDGQTTQALSALLCAPILTDEN